MTRARHSIWTTACSSDRQAAAADVRTAFSRLSSNPTAATTSSPHTSRPPNAITYSTPVGCVCVCVCGLVGGHWSSRCRRLISPRLAAAGATRLFDPRSISTRSRRRPAVLFQLTKTETTSAGRFSYGRLSLLSVQSRLMRKENLSSVHIIRVHRPYSRAVDRPRPWAVYGPCSRSVNTGVKTDTRIYEP